MLFEVLGLAGVAPSPSAGTGVVRSFLAEGGHCMVTPGEGARQRGTGRAAEFSGIKVNLPSLMSRFGADFKLLTCWAPVPFPRS